MSVPMAEAVPVPARYIWVVVPREVCASWWPRPFSEMLAAAERGDDGLRVQTDPQKRVPDPKKSDPDAMKEVDDYPYVVRGCMVFRQVGKRDGWNRDDVATLHTQGW